MTPIDDADDCTLLSMAIYTKGLSIIQPGFSQRVLVVDGGVITEIAIIQQIVWSAHIKRAVYNE